MAGKSKEEEEIAAEADEDAETAETEGAEEAEEIEEGAEEGGEAEASEETAEGERMPRRKRKEKKAVRKRKSRKEKENPLSRAVRLAVETGKVEFGAKTGVKDSLLGKAKLIVVSENSPAELTEDISHYCKLSGIPVLVFGGTSIELGSICGKPYPVSVLSVYDPGSSDIIEIAKKK